MTIGRFPVEAGQVLQFARAIGDTNPVFTDPEAAAAAGLSAIPAPPTFVQASAHFDPDYALRPQPGKPWFGSGREATGFGPDDEDVAAGMLHAEQHFVYHRPLLVGDVLSATEREGDTWTKQGRRGGELRFFELITDFHDEAGELVVTARVVGVSTQHQPQEA
jgi:acyl dehydratase